MPDGWACDACHVYHDNVIICDKITVDLCGADYAAVMTVCSLECFDSLREEIEDAIAVGKEHYPRGIRRDTVLIEWQDEDGNWAPDREDTCREDT